MIIKRETITSKKFGFVRYEVKRTSWWLFGIIPIYIIDELGEKY